ncbi:MAG: type II toxin-antitoxin system VapC family toxin [Deltaproteobacteria bacterium]|nr:type II toxin-antitoxin system VapC family toxin [Deltaproteobacteria bacterium]
MEFLVDSNVFLDVLTDDPTWLAWSGDQLADCAERGSLVINPIIYAEVSIGFRRIEELEEALPVHTFRRAPVPWETGFLAGKAFLSYRTNRGTRRTPLPDFYIGAHAAVAGFTLVTRDAARYRTYFPTLPILAPPG